MRIINLTAAAALVATMASAASAHERQLDGLTAEEAAVLITKLEDAQSSLRAGEFQPFTLLAGSVASYDQTNTPPREAFLNVPFENVWKISRVETGNTAWQPYRLSYAPDGPGQRYWDVEAVLGSGGRLEKVTLDYKVPAPF